MSKTEKSWLVSEYTREIRGLSAYLRKAHGLARKTVIRQLHAAYRELRQIQRESVQYDGYLRVI